jgi:hypothetical protein
MRKTMKTVKSTMEKLTCLILIVSLSGCDLGWDRSSLPKISDRDLKPLMATIIDEQLDIVLPYLEDDFPATCRETVRRGDIEGSEVVELTLEEDLGREYLEFGYAVAVGDDADTVVDYAERLLPAQEFAQLQDRLRDAESSIVSEGGQVARRLPPSQREAFMKDLQKLVTRTVVLMTAGIVYACIPSAVFWGKVTAASAIAVAAGVVSTTIMSIWRYYEFDMDVDQAFEDWLKSVTIEPETAYALAASVIAMGTTLKRGPVVTGIVLGVFAIYNVIDMVRPMLKLYNFNA